jgi:uncharacterized membrane protein
VGGWDDGRVQWAIGTLLRWGVILAAATVLAGGTLYLAHDATTPVDYSTFRGETPDLRSIPGIARHALSLDPRALIQLGILLLILTPVARVALSIAVFALQRDGTYVAITLLVLAVLLLSLAKAVP